VRFLPCLFALVVSPAFAAAAPTPADVDAGGLLRVCLSLAVVMKERVVLVQAGEKQMLLGVAPGNVRTLHVFDQPIAVATPNAVSPAAAFKTVFAQWRGVGS
jgi:flagellar protein FliO/FliZ